YGGAYAYGKTARVTDYGNGKPTLHHQRQPPEQWLALLPQAHEGYIDWEQFQQNQQRIADNAQGFERVGAARRGPALLAGLLRCRRCGRKLQVHYTGRGREHLRYACRRGHLDLRELRCISFGGQTVDVGIGREVLRVVQPAAVEAARLAHEQAAASRDEVLAVLERDREAARYAADRAQRQYDAADPENRQVADVLERRWDQALQRLEQAQQRIDQHQAQRAERALPAAEELAGLADDLEALWGDDACDPSLKKRIVRALIEEVVADADEEAGEVVLVIHWKGGAHTQLRLPRRRRGCCRPTGQDVIEAVRSLSRIQSDQGIAGLLNRNKLRTGQGNRWTRMRVTALRCRQDIPC
ncbi:MAG TPA: recombinase family protein, partial [Vicinamibacteria bacterium]|nr:recombinase family protein [Vicinamibacteria bacterium]